mgnify:CR=1 FL=1
MGEGDPLVTGSLGEANEVLGRNHARITSANLLRLTTGRAVAA